MTQGEPDSTNMYHDSPDPLSVLLKRLELNAEVYVNGDFCGNWAVDTAGSRRIPFHLIGSGEAWLHHSQDAPQPLTEKDLVLFPRDAHHVIASAVEAPPSASVNAPMSGEGTSTHMVCGFFEFHNVLLFPLLDSLPEAVLLRSDETEQGRRVSGLIDLILLELREARPGAYAVVDQLAYLLFVEILRGQVESGAVKNGLLVALFDPRLAPALDAIHENAAAQWTLGALAEKAAMSRSNFAERFSTLLGVTPVKYVLLWRMTEARRLLTTTQLSTAQIAEQVGYESDAAFRKAFKNTQGVPPGEVRKGARSLAIE